MATGSTFPNGNKSLLTLAYFSLNATEVFPCLTDASSINQVSGFTKILSFSTLYFLPPTVSQVDLLLFP